MNEADELLGMMQVCGWWCGLAKLGGKGEGGKGAVVNAGTDCFVVCWCVEHGHRRPQRPHTAVSGRKRRGERQREIQTERGREGRE